MGHGRKIRFKNVYDFTWFGVEVGKGIFIFKIFKLIAESRLHVIYESWFGQVMCRLKYIRFALFKRKDGNI